MTQRPAAARVRLPSCSSFAHIRRTVLGLLLFAACWGVVGTAWADRPFDFPAANPPANPTANPPANPTANPPANPTANPPANPSGNSSVGPSPLLGLSEGLGAGPKAWTSPEGLGSTLQVMLLLTVLSLAPAALLMTTCFVRIVVVLSLLRQASARKIFRPRR